MRITKITKSNRIPERFYLDFDSGEKLTVNTAIIADFCLYSGLEFEFGAFEELKSASSAYSAKSRALKIMGSRNMSRKELTRRLEQKGEVPEQAEKAADFMERIGAVNDAEYSALIVRHYSAKGYGRKRVEAELYRRGIEKELWAEALAFLPDPEEGIKAFINAHNIVGGNPADIKKTTDALLRRGYSWEDIKHALSTNVEGFEE